MGKTSKAYAEGYAAYPEGTNPYESNASDSTNWNDWNDGFAAALHDNNTTQDNEEDDFVDADYEDDDYD